MIDKRRYPTEIQWLKRNHRFFSIYAIENELKISNGIINHFVRDSRPLHERWWPQVVKWVKEIKK